MTDKRICIIAQFPPPIHGLSKAVDSLYNSRLKKKYHFTKVDISENKRFLINLFSIITSKADLFYLTLSQSKFGNIRDLMLLTVIRLKGKKCVIHLHGGYFRKLLETNMFAWQVRWNKKILRSVNAAIVLGNSLRAIFSGLVPESRMYIVKNCVDEQYLLREEAFVKKAERIETEPLITILYLSNMIQSKGYMKILELAKIEKLNRDLGNNPHFHFDFAGAYFEDSERTRFNDYVVNNSLETVVTYHGVVEKEEKMELIRKSTWLALLTNYPKEGQPISILEGMGNGLAILTTRYAGIPDVVESEKNGLLVSKDESNMNTVYAKLVEMSNDKKWLTTVSQNNRKLILENFTEAKYINAMDDVFEKAFQ